MLTPATRSCPRAAARRGRPSPRARRRCGWSRRSRSRCARPSRRARRRRARPRSAPGRRRGASRPRATRRRGPSRTAISRHSVAKWPVSDAITLSPGDSVLTSAASHAPVPDAGIDDHRPGGLEHLLHAGDDLEPELGEVRPAVVDRRRVDGPQHPVGHVRGAGDLQEVSPGAIHQTFHTVARTGSRLFMGELAATLGRELAGEVRDDAYTRHLFAGDASLYAVEPLAVAFPRDADDVAAAVTIAGAARRAGRPARRRHEPGRPDRRRARARARHVAPHERDRRDRRRRAPRAGRPGRRAGGPQPRGAAASGSASGRTRRRPTGPRSAA